MTCPHDPMIYAGEPIGMYHCPECGEMVAAGCPHPDYDVLDETPWFQEDEDLALLTGAGNGAICLELRAGRWFCVAPRLEEFEGDTPTHAIRRAADAFRQLPGPNESEDDELPF